VISSASLNSPSMREAIGFVISNRIDATSLREESLLGLCQSTGIRHEVKLEAPVGFIGILDS
jgi:hypothetical protein